MKKFIPFILLLASCSNPSPPKIQPLQAQVEQRQLVVTPKAEVSPSLAEEDENLQQSFKKTLDLAQKQLEDGTISRQKAEKQFKQVRDNSRVDTETQKLAHKLFMDSRQTEIDKQTTLSENRIGEIKQLFYQERISDPEKERRINIETTQGLTSKLKITQDMIREEESFNKQMKSKS